MKWNIWHRPHFLPYLPIRYLGAFNSLKMKIRFRVKLSPFEAGLPLLDLVSCCYFAVVSTLKSVPEWVLIGTKINISEMISKI